MNTKHKSIRHSKKNLRIKSHHIDSNFPPRLNIDGIQLKSSIPTTYSTGDYILWGPKRFRTES